MRYQIGMFVFYMAAGAYGTSLALLVKGSSSYPASSLFGSLLVVTGLLLIIPEMYIRINKDAGEFDKPRKENINEVG